jgi:small-conductance mechanosensitive channel
LLDWLRNSNIQYEKPMSIFRNISACQALVRVTTFTLALYVMPGLGSSLVHAAPLKAAEDTARDGTVKPDAQLIQSEQNTVQQDNDAEEVNSDSETIIKLQSTIKSDKANLVQLKKSLQGKQTDFEDLGRSMSKLNGTLADKKTKLQAAQQSNDTARIKALQAEIAQLQTDYKLYKTQSDLVLQSELTAKKQITVLEGKIKADQKELAILKGELPRSVAHQPGTPIQAGTTSDSASPDSLISKTVPGAAGLTTTTGTEPAPDTIPETQETAEQIAARSEAQKKATEAQQAEQAIVEAVARKQALEEQIALEEKLLATARQSLANLTQALKVKEKELRDLKAKNGDLSARNKVAQLITEIRQEIDKAENEIKQRTGQIAKLNQQLVERQESQEKVVQIAEQKQQQAEEARKKSIWLESPLHPRNIFNWMLSRGPRVLFVLIGTFLLLILTRISFTRIAHVMSKRSRGKEEARVNRANTLSVSFQSLARVIIIFGGLLLMLEEAGVDIKTVLGGAAIIGLAFAFGAQNLMRDYFTGFMIMLEDQYELGDVVSIGNITGTVETVNMRTTVLRDIEGRVHFIPNGEVKQVTNRTYGWAQAVFDINVAYKENVDHVMDVLMDCANKLRTDPEFSSFILAEPIMLGVNDFADAAVQIKFMLKTRPDKMWPVRRELLRRIKNRFDQEGIEIPIPQRVIYQQNNTTPSE